jgi:transcriptional regulator with XRE-family HTH domain
MRDPNRITEEFGATVRERRKRLGLSQEDLASRAALHRTYVGMIERGEKNVTLRNIEKLSRALNCSMADLFGDVGGP